MNSSIPGPRAIVLVFLLALLSSVVARAGARHELYRGWLRGEQVLCEVDIETDGSGVGRLFLPGGVTWMELSGKMSAGRPLHLTYSPSGSEKVAATFDVTFARGGSAVAVMRWQRERRNNRLELRRIARYVSVDVRQRGKVLSTVYPVFENLPDSLDREVNESIAAFVRDKARTYGARKGETYNGVHLKGEMQMSVTWIDSGLVGLDALICETTGGPHLNYTLDAITLAVDGGRLHRLRFADLFRTDRASRRRLAAICLLRVEEGFDEAEGYDYAKGMGTLPREELAEGLEKGSSVYDRIEDFIYLGYLQTFHVLPRGIEFTWMESDVEAPSSIIIPYRELRRLMKPGVLDKYRRLR